jgi:uroporphyrinogen-III synthase
MSRSRPGADRQASELERAGHRVVVAPVLQIEPVAGPVPRGPFDRAVFLSEHAVRFGLPALAHALPRDRLFAVGSRTAAALAARGMDARAPEDPRSEGLLAMPELQDLAGERVLLVSGAGGRALLGDELAARGARVSRFECYRRVAVHTLDPAVRDCDAIIAASADGLRQVAALWLGAGGRPDVPVLVPSARVARAGVELGLSRLHDCGGADTDAWLRGLEHVGSPGAS